MLQPIEPVEIFDQFIFLALFQRDNITFGELIRGIAQCFIDAFCLHTIQFRYIAVDDHLLAAKHDKTTLRSLYLFFFRFHIFYITKP